MVSISLPSFLKYEHSFLTNLFYLVKEKWFLAGSRTLSLPNTGECLPFHTGNQSTGSGPSLVCNSKGMDLDPVSVATVRRYTTAEWKWACLRSCLWLQAKEMRTNLPVMLGACAIPLSRFGGMSTAYSVAGWLNLIRDYCCGAC